MLQYNPSISGSLSVTGSLIVTNGMIGTVSGVDVQIFSSSINQVITGIQAATGSQEGRLSSIESFTSSTSARLNSIETTSASVDTLNNTQNSRLSALETTSASVDTLNIAQNTRLTNLEIKTGSLASTGSNTFIGTQTITGSLYISSDLIVQGSSSLQNITASAVSIGTNLINLNTANPAIRYAGLVIGDSGSIGSSGSFFYDSVQDEMIFVHRGANTTVTSSVVLMGPQTYDSIGSETYLTSNRIPKGAGNEHLADSNISDDGTTVTLISRALSGTSATFSNNVTAVQGIFRNSGVPAIQAFRDLDVTSVGNAGQGIEFGARDGANYVVGATLYGVLENPATNGALALQTLTAGSLTTKLSIDSTGTSTFSSSVGINGGDFRYRPNRDVTNSPALVFKDAGNSALDICSEVIGDANAASRPIAFRVSSVAGGRYEAMRITNEGRVGIGTTTPRAILHIAAQEGTNALTIGAGNAYEIFITGSDAANIYHATPNQAIYLNTNGGPLHLGTSAASTLLTISGSNIGIETSSPAAKLDIRGNVLLKGDNTDGGILTITRRYSTGPQTINFNNNHPSTNLDWTGARITSADAGNYNGYLDFAVSQGNNGSEAAGTAAVASIMRLTKDGRVGIGVTNPTALLQVRGPNAVGTFFDAQNEGAGGATFSRINASSSPYNQYTFANGGVGINTSSPTLNAGLTAKRASGTGWIIDALNPNNTRVGGFYVTGGQHGQLYLANSSGTENVVLDSAGASYLTGGSLGVGLSNPLATLSTLGGTVQIMGDYRNHATIIKSAGTAGTFSGQLTILIPEMSNAGSDGYGGYSCEVYLSAYPYHYCHVWFSGYINGGITPGEATILRSNGGYSISQASYGTYNQGFQFIINYPDTFVHPTARIIFNKGGSPNATAYPANSITAVFS